MVSGNAEARSGSMIGSLGTLRCPSATPLTLMSRCSTSAPASSRYIVVALDTETGAGKPGASKVSVEVPVEIEGADERRLADCAGLMARDDFVDGQRPEPRYRHVAGEPVGGLLEPQDRDVARDERALHDGGWFRGHGIRLAARRRDSDAGKRARIEEHVERPPAARQRRSAGRSRQVPREEPRRRGERIQHAARRLPIVGQAGDPRVRAAGAGGGDGLRHVAHLTELHPDGALAADSAIRHSR